MPVLMLVAQAALCAVLAWIGPSLIELVLVPVPVALAVARRKPGGAGALVAAAALGGLVARGHWGFGVYFAAVASVGFLTGLAGMRGEKYGRTVAAVTAVTALAGLAVVLVHWGRWIDEAAELHRQWRQLMEATPGVAGDARWASVTDQMRLLLEDHWASLGLGVMFWPLLLANACQVTLVSRRMRQARIEPGITGSFGRARTPDWLVLFAIAVALCWFADRQWPGAGLRPYVWNTALALTAVYCMNGLSVIAYGLALWRPGPVAGAAVVSLVLVVCGLHWPVMIGLFDTWADFRARMRVWRAWKKRSDEGL
jgi:hypothetical protein